MDVAILVINIDMKREAGQSGKTLDTLGYRKAAQHVKFKESKMIRQISFITFYLQI